MASTYSPNLRLELIGTGEQQGTWGSTTNTNLGTLLEEAIGGYTSVTVSDVGDTTLTTNNGSADQSRNMVINLTGTISAARNVICPAIEKLYVVKNATTGGLAVTFKVSGQTGVSIPNGSTYFLYVDGTDARMITGSLANQLASSVSITGGTITGITDLAVADGGTGASNATNARTNLGIGTIGTQNSNSVSITGGSITGITDLAVADGGTGASDAANARTNLGLGTGDSPTFTGLTLSGVGSFSAGTALLPSVSTTGDLNTGVWFPAADTVALSTNGSERIRVDSNGSVGIGGTGSAANVLSLQRNHPTGVTASGISLTGEVQSAVTQRFTGYNSNPTIQDAVFTLGNLSHFRASQGTIGVSATVSNQYGFLAFSNLIGATNNYGFMAQNTAAVTSGKATYGFSSQINIATGGGTAWAYFGEGTANSYFGGNVGIGTTTLSNTNLYITSNITGATASFGVISGGTIQSDVTLLGAAFATNLGTANASFTIGNVTHYRAGQGTFGASSTVSAQYGFLSSGNLIGAGSNFAFAAIDVSGVTSGKVAYAFWSGNNVATGGGTTWGFYGFGTAWSYFSAPVIFDTNLWVDAPAPTVATGAATLTAAQIRTGIVSTTGTSYTLTLPTGTDIDSSFTGIPANVNIGFDVSFVNTASGTITIAVNTGVTSLGSLTIATGTSAMFRFRRTAANTYVVYRIA